MATQNDETPTTTQTKTFPSRRRHVHPALGSYGARVLQAAGGIPEGISVNGEWSIVTSQGPIGSSGWFDASTAALEEASQPPGGGRRLVLPEMVFPHARVVLQHHQGGRSIKFEALDALSEWAAAHQGIPLPPGIDAAAADDETSTTEGEEAVVVRGVGVLQASDAGLWNERRRQQQQQESRVVGASAFHYDWTYSTPFCGRATVGDVEEPVGESSWRVLDSSGMPMNLLTDRTAPILFFDQIVLLEDDLHDNGLVRYTIKVRVMPSCAYVLAQLFVRVDRVLVRLRETRWMAEFDSGRIYRDVSWREAAWQDLLPRHGLPDDPRAWTTPDETRVVGQRPQNHAPLTTEAALAERLQRLPLVALPDDIPAHAELVVPGGP